MTTAVRSVALPPKATPTSGAQAHRERARDIGVVIGANAVLVVGLWLRHGGLDTLSAPGGIATAIGQLTGLLGAYVVLLELLLMSRIGWLERAIGFDRLAVWHRWTGFAAVTLLTGHVVFITLGYAIGSRQTIVAQTVDFVQHYPDVLMSIVGFALFLAVGVSSARAARRRMTREAWYSVHLYAYLAVALAFSHQLSVGTDFSSDRLARVWWISLYVAVLTAIVLWRVGRPLWFNARHRLRIHSIRPEANGVVSLYLTGERLDEIGAVAGQFFLWRFLTGSGWAKAHPFSLSAAPNGRFLRITVKALGDDTLRMQSLKPGVRVFAEGPYGTFTAQRRTRPRVALIAGGIGITPLRALLQTLPQTPGDTTLLYRGVSHDDMAFRDELHAIADRVGVDVRILPGSDIGDDQTDQLGIPALRHHIPDIAHRDVFVCGPPAMLNALRRRLAALHVPNRQIHYERFEY